MVPVLSALAGSPVSLLTWFCCLVSGLGAVGITMDSIQPEAATALVDSVSGASVDGNLSVANGISTGDLLVLGACVFYALGSVRLQAYASRFSTSELAFTRQSVLALFSTLWWWTQKTTTTTAITTTTTGVGPSLDLDPLAAMLTPETITLLLVLSIGPGALSSFLHIAGQKYVPASKAQVIYSSTPVWSAILAAALLPGESASLGPLGWTGAGLIVASGLISGMETINTDKIATR